MYDSNQTEITYKREPLKLISKPASETTPLFEMTIEQSAMTTTRNDYSTGGVTDLEETNNRIEFEPPAASTCFIKPILKMNNNGLIQP